MQPLKIPAIVLPLFFTACSSSRNATGSSAAEGPVSQWQSRPLDIDGSDRDWANPLPYNVKAERVSYSISNDDQNLYVLLSTADRQEQQKIIQGGMSVWVNPKGEENKGDAVGIGYPLDEHSDPDRKLMEEAQPQRYQAKQPVTLEQKKTYSLYGFSRDSSIQSYTYGDTNVAGVRMQMDFNNDGVLIYEAAIPLQAIYSGVTPPYPAHHLTVGIFIEPLPATARIPRDGGGTSGLSFGLGGGMGTFGSGAGMGIGLGHEFGIGGGRKPNKTLFDEAQIWQVVQLARSAAH